MVRIFAELRVWWWLWLCRKPGGLWKQGQEIPGSQLSDSLGGQAAGTWLCGLGWRGALHGGRGGSGGLHGVGPSQTCRGKERTCLVLRVRAHIPAHADTEWKQEEALNWSAGTRQCLLGLN